MKLNNTIIFLGIAAFMVLEARPVNGIGSSHPYRCEISIYKGSELIARGKVITKKQDARFIMDNFPQMTMVTRVREGWSVSRKYY